MTMIACLLVVLAIALIRAGWGGARGLAGAGWTLAAAALAWLGWQDGAWGIAMGFVVGMATAAAIVLHAAATSPAKPARRSTAPAYALAKANEYALARRFAVFGIVVPLSFAAAQWFAFAVNAALKGDGALDADSVAAMLFVQPTLWAVLMGWQMTMGSARKMLFPPMATAALGLIVWVTA